MKPQSWKLLAFLALALFSSSAFAASGSISVSLSSLNPITAGDSTTLTATVSASGADASGAQVALSLPSGVTSSDSATQSIGTITASSSQSKSWSIFGNSEGTYTITVTASATGVTSQTADATLVVSRPGFITVAQTTTPASSLGAAATTNLALGFSNNGGSSATVTVITTPSSGLTITSGSSLSTFDINAGQNTSQAWAFRMDGTGSQTISVTITSTANKPSDLSFAITGPAAPIAPTQNPGGSNDQNSHYNQTNTGIPASTGGTTGNPASPSNVVTYVRVVPTAIPADIQSELNDTPLTTPEEQAYIDAARNNPISAQITLEVGKRTSNNKTTYTSTFTTTLTNNSSKDLKDVKMAQVIPKSIASNANEISSANTFRVLVADPVLEFAISNINAGQTAKIVYSVNKMVTGADFNAMAAPITKAAVTSPPRVTAARPQPSTSPPSAMPQQQANAANGWALAGIGILSLAVIAAIIIVAALAVFFLVLRKK